MTIEENVEDLANMARRMLDESNDERAFKAQYHLMKVVEALNESPKMTKHFKEKVGALRLVN